MRIYFPVAKNVKLPIEGTSKLVKILSAKSTTSEIPYDPAQLLQSLQEIDVSVLIIAKQTAENIKKDNITMQAAALLGAT